MQTKEITGYPSIDRPWMKFYNAEWYSTKAPECTVYQNVLQNNKDYLNDAAISFFGLKKTYKWMFHEVDKIAMALKSMGIKDGDCVNMCVSYVPEAVCLVLACSKIGALANFVNPVFSTKQKIDRLNDTDSKLLIILDAMFPYMADAVEFVKAKNILILPLLNSLPWMVQKVWLFKSKGNDKLSIFKRRDKRYLSWQEFIRQGKSYKGEIEARYAKNKPFIMVYSSGTTGASKGIVLTNDGINATISNYESPDFKYDRGQTCLSIVPIWFSTGNVLSMLMPLCMGITIILEPVFSKETFADDILKYKANMAIGSSSLWAFLLEHPKYNQADLSFLIYPVTGGELVLPEMEDKINAFLYQRQCKMSIVKGYGMCELGSTVSTSSPVHSKFGSVGYPIKGVTVAAFDTDTNEEMKYNQQGEIRVNSPAHMKEYFKNPQATEEYFYIDANGTVWGCTGDIGYIDEDGDVFILGRVNDSFFQEEGKRIYCFDVEKVICQDETVAECKLVEAITENEKVIVAYIILNDTKESHEQVAKRIRKRCDENLEPCARPQYYKVIQEFPVHANGKRDVEILKRDVDGIKKL